ncbi:hypothetical protein C441_04694 [Haloferax sulfurifontis ATCC BAA-897]|uniref:Uncharacterized protein n=1 Tax=Haloferax sulfurifontis ATCC BAA-897 TaxID=662480 RepID=M0IKS4_9EURY|nr:hypothetical protein C441_04694 [Haloferax sulfurifontis ATCC BAA-897]
MLRQLRDIAPGGLAGVPEGFDETITGERFSLLGIDVLVVRHQAATSRAMFSTSAANGPSSSAM